MEREMERYIHTIHAPADIFQGGCSRFVPVSFSVHALFTICSLFVFVTRNKVEQKVNKNPR